MMAGAFVSVHSAHITVYLLTIMHVSAADSPVAGAATVSFMLCVSRRAYFLVRYHGSTCPRSWIGPIQALELKIRQMP